MTVGTPDVVQLRRLLFGKDYDELLALKEQFEQSDKYSASVANIISEALTLRGAQDNSLSDALAPTIENALTQSICNNPQRFADVLYPVMGPAIRKSINQALSEALETLNQVLESSLSLRSWKWRFDAWRSGQTYAKVALLNTLVYQVEQVFLIHRESGLLLQHVASPHAISKDPAMVSGMLTAIQDFITDSFAVNQTDTLRTLSLGELTVLLEHGPHAVLAMVVRGAVPADLPNLLMETAANIHRQYAPAFKAFNGNTEAFTATENLLADCLKSQQQHLQKRPPWLALLVLVSLVGAASHLLYQHYQQLAQQEAKAKQAQQQVLQTLNERLRELQTHTSELQNSVTTLSDQQRQQLRQQTQQAQQLATAAQTISKLTQQIEASTYPFEAGKADVGLDDPMLLQLGKTIRELIQAAHQTGKTPQILIAGNADDSGTNGINQKLAELRAENLRDALVRGGVPAFAVVAYSAKQAGQPATLQKNERSTSYRVTLF